MLLAGFLHLLNMFFICSPVAGISKIYFFFLFKKSTFAAGKEKQQVGLSLLPHGKRGKSGQHRALHFLTESRL